MSGLAAYAIGMLVSICWESSALRPSYGGAVGWREFAGSDRYFLLSLAAILGFSVLMYADMILVKHFSSIRKITGIMPGFDR